MKTRFILLAMVFLIGCAVQEQIEKPEPVVESEPVAEPETEPIPETVVEPEPMQISEPVIEQEPEPVVQKPTVGSGEVQCENPERYTYVGGYCVENACQNKAVKCMKQGNKIMRPECECWMYFGEPICSIKAAEETRINSPLCTRKGHLGRVCGAYDSNKKHCVNF